MAVIATSSERYYCLACLLLGRNATMANTGPGRSNHMPKFAHLLVLELASDGTGDERGGVHVGEETAGVGLNLRVKMFTVSGCRERRYLAS